ncbi:MAG: DEAD/DEAH box helicase [Verrucomicrobia bacterium]|nr:MAG: DEAD/DEAH box helicase [Verrucomicrobiota bacterium]
MKIKFDSNQDFQLSGINAVLDIFEGQPLAQGAFEWQPDIWSGELLSELGVRNVLTLTDETLFTNVCKIQQQNGIVPVASLQGRNFSVEMETGTGKTYVYLRTIYELNARYGWKKFVIVVPSVAIREGVMKTIELTREHFRSIYGNLPVDAWIYDSGQVSKLRQFSTSNQLQVLIINIQAFARDTTVMQNPNDRLAGRKPIEFIQHTASIVILDEPQNMETENARAAIGSLEPLCTLRYSATHRNLYNLLYRLDPVKAYDLKLVKRIEVDAVLDNSEFNKPYIAVKSIKATRSKITAKLEIDLERRGRVRRVVRAVNKQGTDLCALSGGRDIYGGYVVNAIDARNGYVAFANGVTLSAGETHGGRTDEIMHTQMRETIREHLEKELRISQLPNDQRMKVLSLFFIDRVANYVEPDSKFRRWFEELYEQISSEPRYATLNPLPKEQVHNGYFAIDRGKAKDTSGGTKADDQAYNLIMRDKERLLSPDEPLRFIFSHSALREGWDNPNVFQICTLNETSSEVKKRQEIGRGMRLPVRANGERSFDPLINRLTLVANESYRDFANKLQTELQDECGVNFEGRIQNKRDRRKGILKKQRMLDPDFQKLWDKIKQKTRYSVHFDTEHLIIRCATEVRSMPKIESPIIHVERRELDIVKRGVIAEARAARDVRSVCYEAAIPDVLGYLQKETELTRATLVEILARSGRLAEVILNPQQFLDQTLAIIKQQFRRMMIDGIKYERIAGAAYEMMLFEIEELESYATRLIEVQKSIYDVVEFESRIEETFARELDAREDIKLFFKLPDWFKVETPLGTYNPDWGIVKVEANGQDKLYLVRETKGTTEWTKLLPDQQSKIYCARQHFHELGVDYQWVSSAGEV